MLPELLLLLLAAASVIVVDGQAQDETEGHCNKMDKNDGGCDGQISDDIISLLEIEDSWAEEPSKMLFLETSERPYLTPRQACSVESASLNSNLSAILVVMTSTHLDLTSSSPKPSVLATRSLLSKHATRVHFRRVDRAKVLLGTPMEKAQTEGKLDSSRNPIVHYRRCSDLSRSVSSAPVVSGAGEDPPVLDLAHLVNLEYYVSGVDCIHEIPETSSDIADMVNYVDRHHWELTARASESGFSSSCFVNRPKKQMVVVHRGTENWQQVKVDARLALNMVTRDTVSKADWHTMQSLMNHALRKRRDGRFVRNDYSVTITGHSLGGWLAQLCTLICKNPEFHPVGPRGTFYFGNGASIDLNQRYDLHCVAFDSPGARAILDHMNLVASAADRTRVIEALEELDISVYLSNRNVVNSCGSHVGAVERIDALEDTWWYQRWFNPFASHSMDRILNYFKNDAIRLLLVHRLGGWYSDLDMLTIKSLTDLPRNCIGSDQAKHKQLDQDPEHWGDAVSNAIFNFEKGHPVLQFAMDAFSSKFAGNLWSSGGPDLITEALAERCGVKSSGSGKVRRITPDLFNPEKCQGVTVMPPRVFFPFGWYDAPKLYSKKSDEDWQMFFQDSYTVHFFASSQGGAGAKVLKPKYYGRDRPALLYLALRHCPDSYDTADQF